jgi:hypothetical protein
MPSLQSHSAGFEQNSSNKELSPEKNQNKDTAFMRAMLRDDTPRREP